MFEYYTNLSLKFLLKEDPDIEDVDEDDDIGDV